MIALSSLSDRAIATVNFHVLHGSTARILSGGKYFADNLLQFITVIEFSKSVNK